jgi:hypothetical protein
VPLLISSSEVAEVRVDQSDTSEVVHRLIPTEAGWCSRFVDSNGELFNTNNRDITYRWNCIKFNELSYVDGLTSGPHNNFQGLTFASSIGIVLREAEALNFEAAVSGSCLERHLSVSTIIEAIKLCDALESSVVGKTPFIATSGHGPFSECEFSTEVETNHFHVAVIP